MTTPKEFDELYLKNKGTATASEIPIGGAMPWPGTAVGFKTGDWGLTSAQVDLEKCTACTLCFWACPDSAITMNDENKPIIDLDYCKGCELCMKRCPADAIYMVPKEDLGII